MSRCRSGNHESLSKRRSGRRIRGAKLIGMNVRYIPGGSLVARWLPTGDYIVQVYRGHLGWRCVFPDASDSGAALDAAERDPRVLAAFSG